jgi:hypothetical protein
MQDSPYDVSPWGDMGVGGVRFESRPYTNDPAVLLVFLSPFSQYLKSCQDRFL